MFLSRIELNTRTLNTRKLLASPQVMHAALEGCFDKTHWGSNERFMWRLDVVKGRTYVLVQSPVKPDFTNFAAQYSSVGVTGDSREYTSFLSSVKDDKYYTFKLTCNPTMQVGDKVVSIVSKEKQLEWLQRRAEKAGADILFDTVVASSLEWQRFYRGENQKPVEFGQLDFTGVLTVKDAEAFICALSAGIGREKAYGCGLLTIIPHK